MALSSSLSFQLFSSLLSFDSFPLKASPHSICWCETSRKNSVHTDLFLKIFVFKIRKIEEFVSFWGGRERNQIYVINICSICQLKEVEALKSIKSGVIKCRGGHMGPSVFKIWEKIISKLQISIRICIHLKIYNIHFESRKIWIFHIV
jgi:hypothetical protein